MKVADMHCDTIHRLLCRMDDGETVNLRENTGHIDLLRMKESHYLVQNFAMFVEMEEGKDPWERILRLQALFEKEMAANADLIAQARSFSDIEKNEKAGKMSAMLTVEEGGVCKGEMEKLEALYEMGVRMITLTWNFPNELGYPNLNPENPDFLHVANTTQGLTEKGKEFVVRMEELGIIPDVSHLSDAGFWDVLAVTKKPFVASHSNARALCPCVRNLTDEMIHKLAERGGLTGLNFCPDFLKEAPEGAENPGNIASAVRQVQYLTNLGGIEFVGLGSDFDGIGGHADLKGAQSMEVFWDALKKGGFSEDALDRIFWKNVMRVYRETLA